MLHIHEDLKHEISQELIEVSEQLVNQSRALENEPPKEEKGLNESILEAEEEYRKAEILQDYLKKKETATIFQKLRQKKRWLNDQAYRQRKLLSFKVEQLTFPVIEQASRLLDQAIAGIKSQRIFPEVIGRKHYIGDPKDFYIFEVTTNREAIISAIVLLRNLRLDLNKMRRSSIGEILSAIKEVVDKVNAIDLKKTETVFMKDWELEDEKIHVQGEKEWKQDQSSLREMADLARIGKMNLILDEAKALVKKIKDEAAARVTNGKVTDYDKLGRGEKEALDVVYGKKK